MLAYISWLDSLSDKEEVPGSNPGVSTKITGLAQLDRALRYGRKG